ncbi:MAG TPA: DUF2970 domain-containing protein [Gammaproteobacteria bacterium]|nr:DUF2970 domain-containing protein [Gammaproteobacteria bacterium]
MTETDKSPGPLQIIGSVLAAMFGVQSRRNQERDFTSGRPGAYIVAGLIMTAVFVLVIVGVVNLVLSLVG